MTDKELLEFLDKEGVERHRSTASWDSSAWLLSALDAIARSGGNAVVKIDGGRDDGRIYTIVVTGGRLGDAFFRKDGSELQDLLREAIAFWVDHVSR